MAGMGVILVVYPDLLSNLLTAIALLVGSVSVTVVMVVREKRRTAAA